MKPPLAVVNPFLGCPGFPQSTTKNEMNYVKVKRDNPFEKQHKSVVKQTHFSELYHKIVSIKWCVVCVPKMRVYSSELQLQSSKINIGIFHVYDKTSRIVIKFFMSGKRFKAKRRGIHHGQRNQIIYFLLKVLPEYARY